MNSRNFFKTSAVLFACACAPSGLSKTVKSAALPAPKSTSSVSERDRDFERANELFKNGDEEAAIVSLTDYLRRYPTSDRADDAQYLLGEIEYRRRNFAQAIRELKKTLEYRKRGGDRVADAFYLIGESLIRLGEKEKARIEWEALKRIYPRSPAAERAALKLMEPSQ